jgi:hypothetical protein
MAPRQGEVIMDDDLRNQAQSIAKHLALRADDPVEHCRAEREFRVLAFRSFMRALGAMIVDLIEDIAELTSDAPPVRERRNSSPEAGSPVLR